MPGYSVSVSLPAQGLLESNLQDIRVVQQEYRHDVASYVSTRPARSYSTGAPVHITWRTGRASADFHGYVHHVEPMGEGVNLVMCRSASMVLDNGLQAVFRDRTLPSVIREVARLTRFDAEVGQHGQLFDLAATGGRMWETLVEYAKTIGFSFYAHNTRLALHARTQLVDRFAAEAPVLRNLPTTREHSLYDFKPIDGHTQPGRQRAKHVITGLNPRTGSTFSVTGGVASTKLGRDMTLPVGTLYKNIGSSTPQEARWTLAALAETGRFNLTASATADGFPRVHQTWPVLVAGVDPVYEGLWFVHKVTHLLSGPVYVMDLELGKDGKGSTVPIPGVRERRPLVLRSNPQGRPKAAYPPVVLADGQWQAQWSASARTFPDLSRRVSR